MLKIFKQRNVATNKPNDGRKKSGDDGDSGESMEYIYILPRLAWIAY